MGGAFFVMPYSKVSKHPKCPADKPLGLVLSESGKLLGCHVNEESANKQIAKIEMGKHTGEIEELSMGENVMHYTRALPDMSNIRAEELLKDTSLPVPFIASTEGGKSDGMNLRNADWVLDRFRGYGRILWVHDYTHPPLGTGTARIEDTLRIDITYDTDDPFAMLVRGKAIKGMMGGSVGWATTKDKKNELVEFSNVPVGIDPDSLPDIQRMGLRAMQAEISSILGEDTNTSLEEYIKELRQDVLEQIMETLNEVINLDEQDGQERDLSEEEISALIDVGEELDEENEPSETRGEEEEDIETEGNEDELARAGAMLSKKNREDLEMALALIQGVIERATPDEPVPTFSAMRGDEEEEETEEVEEIENEPEEAGETVSQRGQDVELDPSLVDQIKEVIG